MSGRDLPRLWRIDVLHVRLPLVTCLLLLGLMWLTASMAAAQAQVPPETMDVHGITVNLTVAFAAGSFAVVCAWKVAKPFMRASLLMESIPKQQEEMALAIREAGTLIRDMRAEILELRAQVTAQRAEQLDLRAEVNQQRVDQQRRHVENTTRLERLENKSP